MLKVSKEQKKYRMGWKGSWKAFSSISEKKMASKGEFFQGMGQNKGRREDFLKIFIKDLEAVHKLYQKECVQFKQGSQS